MPEMVVADVIQGRRRGVAGDVAAEARIILVGAQHHDHRIPARVVADLLLHLVVARRDRLLVGGDGIGVFGVGAVGHVDAGLVTQRNQLFEQEMGALGTFLGR
jgi:hypothetical protein